MKLPTLKGEHSCKFTELSLKTNWNANLSWLIPWGCCITYNVSLGSLYHKIHLYYVHV